MGQIVLQTNQQLVNGEVKVVTTKTQYSTITSDMIIARIAQSAGIKVADAKAAILGIQQAVKYFVLNGHSIQMGDFGTITVNVSASSVAKASQVSADLIKKLSIGYKPSQAIKNELANISFS